MRAVVVLIVLVLGSALALPAGDVDAAPQLDNAPMIEVVEDADADVVATTLPDHAVARAPRGLATVSVDEPPPTHRTRPPVPPPRR